MLVDLLQLRCVLLVLLTLVVYRKRVVSFGSIVQGSRTGRLELDTQLSVYLFDLGKREVLRLGPQGKRVVVLLVLSHVGEDQVALV